MSVSFSSSLQLLLQVLLLLLACQFQLSTCPAVQCPLSGDKNGASKANIHFARHSFDLWAEIKWTAAPATEHRRNLKRWNEHRNNVACCPPSGLPLFVLFFCQTLSHKEAISLEKVNIYLILSALLSAADKIIIVVACCNGVSLQFAAYRAWRSNKNKIKVYALFLSRRV